MLEYLGKEFLPKIQTEEFTEINPQLRKVVVVSGKKPEPEHGVSIALSLEFKSEKTGYKWHDTVLNGALEVFRNRFGQEAFYFITLLENIPIS